MSETPRSVDEKVVLVLGASGGIGAALSRRLAARGVRVEVAARPSDRLDALANELGRSPRGLDATSLDEVKECVQGVVQEAGRLDGIANCVGSLLLKPAHRTSAAEFAATLATNLGSAFNAVASAAPQLRATGGSIVLVSSAAASTGMPNHEAIAAAKAGIEGLARSAAASYGSSGVRVNVVAPGLVQTPLTDRITRSEAAAEASRGMHALGRLGAADDVAGLMDWLLSDESTWVTGQVMGVDGGLARVRPPQRIAR
jgi:NAD(P)-dependent dehydrogenase (short-subunit alcohol dehydrogenase family)